MKLSIVIPAYNEEKRLPPTLVSVFGYLKDNLQNDSEVLVVTDGSKDRTVQVVQAIAQQEPQLRVIVNHENRGKGAVVKQGMLAAKGEYILFMDADNSTRIEELDAMLPLLDSRQYDIIIGSRDLGESTVVVRQNSIKELAGYIGNLFIQTMVLPGIQDTQCGFKVFTKESAQTVFQQSSLKGWSFDIEVLSLARNLGYRIKEMPVMWYNDTNSHVKVADYIRVLLDVVKIRFRLWFGYYQK